MALLMFAETAVPFVSVGNALAISKPRATVAAARPMLRVFMPRPPWRPVALSAPVCAFDASRCTLSPSPRPAFPNNPGQLPWQLSIGIRGV